MSKAQLVDAMDKALEALTKWMEDLGICHFWVLKINGYPKKTWQSWSCVFQASIWGVQWFGEKWRWFGRQLFGVISCLFRISWWHTMKFLLHGMRLQLLPGVVILKLNLKGYIIHSVVFHAPFFLKEVQHFMQPMVGSWIRLVVKWRSLSYEPCFENNFQKYQIMKTTKLNHQPPNDLYDDSSLFIYSYVFFWELSLENVPVKLERQLKLSLVGSSRDLSMVCVSPVSHCHWREGCTSLCSKHFDRRFRCCMNEHDNTFTIANLRYSL